MSSPFRRPKVALSSSPLPSLDQILSQIKKPEVFVAESPRMYTSATSFIRPEPNPIDLTTPIRAPSEPIEVDDEVVIVKILPPGLRGRRKKGTKKLLEWKQTPKTKTPPKDDKPWRKYQETPSPDAKKGKKTRGKAKQEEEVVRSRHFETTEEPEEKKKKREKKEPRPKLPHEPLLLAPAERRRADWTPPPPDGMIELSSSAPIVMDPSTTQDPSSIALAPGQSFGSLLEAYGLPEEEPAAEKVVGPGPVTEMLRKRKLAEAAAKEARSRETSPVKKPAKKKKPRTITEVATAAYALPEPEPTPTLSMLDYLAPEPGAEDKPKPDGKKVRKPRPKKAKALPPPEPILLSPGTAIREVYAQDFVFGTSSQLVLGDLSPVVAKPRPPPPMFTDEDPFTTPINSDAVEPEPKKKLWEVGARDEDGRLVDLPVINLVEEMDVDEMGLEINPFGYAGPRPMQKKKEEAPQLEDPFASSDPPEPRPLIVSSDPPEPEQLPPKAGTVTTKASVAGLGKAACTPPNTIPSSQQPTEAVPSVAVTVAPPPEPAGPPRPKYDLFTDAQLAREVAKFGFKSIKRRTAMLALLEQCWDSKNGTRAPLSPLPSNRSLSTTTATSAPAKVAASPKKPRGRPKKTAEAPVEQDPNEPPPSGQPVVSPKKPRGRPRKDKSPAASPTRSRGRPRKDASPAASPAKPRGRPRKDASPVRKPADATPKTPEKRRKAAPKAKAKSAIVIEIPDSEADDTDDLDMCASSPEMVFSSPGEGDPDVDVTLSLDDKMEGSLAVGAGHDQSSLMSCITQAVQSAPPTKDPAQPSWHEKMLMYEPVILEDLAAWLNTGPLTNEGYDGEVSPGEVKQWCDSKSVCCLWRMNISGKERKRF
ncbi:hypothetical protein B0T11DRAFT_276293 [Plectosphaerella cucumerina]|uniref:Structure-specific endonuclease subunit SLX4 n=1 Tax=Plectosphaerella cucumerina TaxID=40658 RepID=A0A8K0X7J4_9PEZI|nr:hypothetical protein B0T11DRAFT_276293 [Plectosphaerella cucumerina]